MLVLDPDLLDRWEEGGLRIRGKVDLAPRFDFSQPWSVEVRLSPVNTSRPNLNIVAGNEGGWTGWLCGGGFVQGALTELRSASGEGGEPSAPA